MTHNNLHESQALCPACEIGPFIRNHYFTGKLMLERDFTEEQRYFIEKLLHHHQRLHGWGVVCGLKVKQHENPVCRDRYICIEPGTAIDCCGHEIVVREEECIDITQLPSIKALIDEKNEKPHTLQICLRYRECPTEEIPVLYDECGCDDMKCAPNRILESYDIDVIIDPPTRPDTVNSPRLTWKDNVTLLADVSRIAVYHPGNRMYLLVGDDVYQVDTTTRPIVGPNFHLAANGLEMAVSNNGKHLFAVTEPPPGSATNERQMVVLRTSDMEALYLPFDLQTSVGSEVRLVVTSDDRLMALVGTSGNVLIWTEAELTGATAPGSRTPVALGTKLQSLAVSADAQRGYSLGSTSNAVHVLNAAGAGSPDPDITILPSVAKPTIVAVVPGGDTEFLVVADATGKRLYLVRLSPLGLSGEVALTHEPIGLAISPGGRWAYILERNGDQSFVQVVDLYRLQRALPAVAGTPLQVGDASQQVVVSASGKFLYVPFLGAPANTFDGGVAKIEVDEGACEEILWRHLGGCPQCDTPNCVVLATIEHYQVGDKIEDQTDPPADPAADIAVHVARIDNRKGRQLLPSTQVLKELIECLMQQGPGGIGTQGPPGSPGKEGLPGDKGDKGDPGPGLERGLTRIEALSWTHNNPHRPTDFLVQVTMQNERTIPGIVIGFTDEVQVSKTIDGNHVFQVLVETTTGQNREDGIVCRCAIRGSIAPVQLKLDVQGRIDVNAQGRIDAAIELPPGNARGVAFLLDPEIPIARSIVNGRISELWILLRGDFVRDTNGRAIDAEFVRVELPTGDRPSPPSGQPLADQLGIQGGTFESWFSIIQD
jgi:DNA-binding beta-propeller fold protein YncE